MKEICIDDIKNAYAVEQGYDNWFQLLTWRDFNSHEKAQIFLKHENEVIQLIQDELKKKICMGKLIPLPFNSDYDDLEKEIINTENIK